MSEAKELRDEIHEMRCDFKSLGNKLAELTEVIIRKEESDKYLEVRIEKLESEDVEKEKRIRATEDFITKSNPWINATFKIVTAVGAAALILWMGLKQ